MVLVNSTSQPLPYAFVGRVVTAKRLLAGIRAPLPAGAYEAMTVASRVEMSPIGAAEIRRLRALCGVAGKRGSHRGNSNVVFSVASSTGEVLRN